MCVCVCVCVCVRARAYTTSSSFSVNGHLGCLHVLATVNSAAMNTEVYCAYTLSDHVFLWIYAQEWNHSVIQ